jgi:hypothetical protein
MTILASLFNYLTGIKFQVGLLYYLTVIEFIPKPNPLTSIFNTRASYLGKWGWMFLLLFFAFGTKVEAQVAPSWDYLFFASGNYDFQTDFYPTLNEEERQMVDSLKRLSASPYIQMIYQDAGKYFLMNACSLVLYQWQDDDWIPNAGKPVKGATCASILFFRDKEPYSYSGVGFWQSHGDIFHFTQTGEVELVKTHHQPSDFYGTLRFTTNSGLYSFFGHHFNLRKEGPEGFLWKGFFLDFSDMNWKEMDFKLNENFEKVFGVKSFDKKLYSISSFESDDFALTELINQGTHQTGLIIVDKRTLELRIQPLTNSYFHELIWLQKKRNSFRFFTSSKPTITELEIGELFKSALPLGKVTLKATPAWYEKIGSHWKEIAGVITTFFALFGFWKVLNHRTVSPGIDQSPVWNKEENHILLLLLPFSGQVISQEDMDRILEIDTLTNQDLRKVRRSRAIKSINDFLTEQDLPPAITRVRDAQDKRIIQYKIEVTPNQKSYHQLDNQQ